MSCPTSSRKSVTGPWIELWLFECWTINLLAAVSFIVHVQLFYSSLLVLFFFSLDFLFSLSHLLLHTIFSVYAFLLMTHSCLFTSGFIVLFSGVCPLVNSKGDNARVLWYSSNLAEHKWLGAFVFCSTVRIQFNMSFLWLSTVGGAKIWLQMHPSRSKNRRFVCNADM